MTNISVADEPSAGFHKGGGTTYVKTPFDPPGDGIGRERTETVPESWHQLSNLPQFLKWQYKDTPYRVIADFEEQRGHWRSLFTSTYGHESHLIRGNCGSGESGMMKAVVAANQFMQENKYGCPPPSEY